MEDLKIEIEKTPEFLESAHKVSDYLKDLPLTVEQNDHLIKLLVDHGDIGRHDALLQGFRMGIELMKPVEPTDPAKLN